MTKAEQQELEQAIMGAQEHLAYVYDLIFQQFEKMKDNV